MEFSQEGEGRQIKFWSIEDVLVTACRHEDPHDGHRMLMLEYPEFSNRLIWMWWDRGNEEKWLRFHWRSDWIEIIAFSMADNRRLIQFRSSGSSLLKRRVSFLLNIYLRSIVGRQSLLLSYYSSHSCTLSPAYPLCSPTHLSEYLEMMHTYNSIFFKRFFLLKTLFQRLFSVLRGLSKYPILPRFLFSVYANMVSNIF